MVVWYHVKGLVTRNTHMRYESCISSGKRVTATVKYFQKLQVKFKVKVTRPIIMVPSERSCHKQYTYAI